MATQSGSRPLSGAGMQAAPLAVQVYPSGAAIPENLLRFHLRFAQPVEVINLNERIRLCDSAGGLVEHAFVDLPHGLWDADVLTLTVMMHPGRIKHGLQASKQLGLALETESSYILQVNAPAPEDGVGPEDSIDWRTVHAFKAHPAVNEAIKLSKWSLRSPQPHSIQPLRVLFGRPLDWLSITTSLQVLDSKGRVLESKIAAVCDETGAAITPLEAWVPGVYSLAIHHEIEDAAGNRIGNAFESFSAPDHDLMQPAQTFSLPFTVR
jgi:hypothetical protein